MIPISGAGSSKIFLSREASHLPSARPRLASRRFGRVRLAEPSGASIPNVTIRSTVGESLLVKNATTAPLTLLPGPEHPNLPQITLSPGQSTDWISR